MKIVVIGGTGLIGSKTVRKLKERGHAVVAAAPNTGVNTLTGEGLGQALNGAETVIDVSNSPSFEEHAATDFFQRSGRNLIATEVDAGVRHHIVLSVVGTDRLQDSGYFRAKLGQEKLIHSSPIPYTLIHATQFFEFIRTIADISTVNGVVRLPPVHFEPMAAEDVAEEVANVSLGEPRKGMIEIGGPETFTLDQAVREVLEHDRDPRRVVADPSAPYYGVQVSERTLVPQRGARRGATRLDWWLRHVPAPPKAMVPPAPMPAH